MSEIFDAAEAPIPVGISLVEASAGTGKTYSLVCLVLRALLEDVVDSIDQILVVTFTNAATDELITRIRASLTSAVTAFERGEEAPDELIRALVTRHGEPGVRKLRKALRDFDRIGVSTIHGFCHRVLVETAFESGTPYDVELIDDARVLLERAARDFWRTQLYGLDGAVAALVGGTKLTPDSLLRDYEMWKRHPGTRIVPDAAPLADLVRRLAPRLEELRSSWNRKQVERFLDRLPFNKSSGLCAQKRRPLLDALDAYAAGSDGHIAVATGLTSANIRDGQSKKSKERREPPYRLAPIAACDALAEARVELAHSVRCAFIADVDKRVERIKQDAAAWSHDDLIRRLRQALDDEARARAVTRAVTRKYRVAFIDEFQDTDHDQYAIFRTLFRKRPVYLIGDPKQAIYAFRGADVYAYLKAKQDSVAAYTLACNRRSTDGLVRAVNHLFSARDHAFAEQRIGFEHATAAEDAPPPIEGDGGRPLEWLWLGNHSNKEAGGRLAVAATVHEIVALLDGAARMDGRRVEPQDIAVLVGRHAEARAMRAALAAAGVPAVQRRSGDIHASDEMSELGRLAAAVADPAVGARVKAALATRLWGMDPRQIRRAAEDEDHWQGIVEMLAEHRDLWLRRGFMCMVGSLAARLEIRPRLSAYEDGDRRLTNLRHAAEVLHQAELEHHLSPDGLLRWLERERVRSHGQQDAAELRIEREARSVEIVTVHASKGLQYEIVFCPFLWSAKPAGAGKPALRHIDLDRVEMHCSPAKGDEFLELADNERLAQDVRVAYVALTRARRRCYVGYGGIGTAAARGALAHLLGVKNEAKSTDFELPLRRLVAASDDTMRLRDVSDHTGAPERAAAEPTAVPLNARTFAEDSRARLRGWRVASFSALTGAGAAERPDHLDPASTSLSGAATVPGPAEADNLFAFARGPRAGTCLHEIIEHVDLARVDDPAVAIVVQGSLERHGLANPGRHPAAGPGYGPARAVAAMLTRLARAVVPGQSWTLAEADSVFDEWQFYLPMGELSPRDLAALFAAHGADSVAGRYAPALERLDAGRARGFLVGFVDAVISHEGRWYVVDWKSNHLGDTHADYAADAIERTMIEADYVLQYHIYVLGLHRYLRARLPDYDYDRDVGGALYVFLRGLSGDDGRAEAGATDLGPAAGGVGPTGWFCDRPPRALIEALDRFITDGVVAR